VTAIQGCLAANLTAEACATLGDFINEVNAETGKRLATAQAASLNSLRKTSKPPSTAKQNDGGQQKHHLEAGTAGLRIERHILCRSICQWSLSESEIDSHRFAG
jgi:hypothetical protein